MAPNLRHGGQSSTNINIDCDWMMVCMCVIVFGRDVVVVNIKIKIQVVKLLLFSYINIKVFIHYDRHSITAFQWTSHIYQVHIYLKIYIYMCNLSRKSSIYTHIQRGI